MHLFYETTLIVAFFLSGGIVPYASGTGNEKAKSAAPDKGFTPEKAAALAISLNPSLRALRDQRGLTEAELVIAGIIPNPELDMSFTRPTGGDTAGTVDGYDLELTWEVSSLVGRGHKKQGARFKKEQIDLEIAWREWQIAVAAKSVVFDLTKLHEQILLSEKALNWMTENISNIRKSLARGAVTADILNPAEAIYNKTEETLLENKKEAVRQNLALKSLFGQSDDGDISLNKDILLPSHAELPGETVFLEGLEKRRFDLLALSRGRESQNEAVRTALLERLPKIRLGPTISQDPEKIRTTGFIVNVDVPVFNLNRGRVGFEKATQKKLADEYNNRVFEARSDVKILISSIHFLNEQIELAMKSEKSLSMLANNYTKALLSGRADALSYYTVLNDYIQAQIRVVMLKGDLAKAMVLLGIFSGFYELPKPERSGERLS